MYTGNFMSYGYRKDGRTDDEFKRDIKTRTDKERRAVISLVWNWLRKESPNCKLEDNGCGNDGKVLREGVTQAADFKLKGFRERDYLLEMKVSSAPCVTLKEDQVGTFNQYGNREDVLVDWCVNFERADETHYLMTPSTSLKLFREHGQYDTHSGFGDKPGWRLFQRDLDRLTAEHPVSKLSKTLNSQPERKMIVFYKGAQRSQQ